MRYALLCLFLTLSLICHSQEDRTIKLNAGYEQRIRHCIDTMKIIDTHEHFYDPEIIKLTNFFDFSLLLQQNSWDGLVASGLDKDMVWKLYSEPTSVQEKWKIIEPYWNKSSNTIANRILLMAIRDLYGIDDLNGNTVENLTGRIRKAYSGEWYNYILKELCNFSYVITDGDSLGKKYEYVKYVKRFSEWLTLDNKFILDSIAVVQVEPIYKLEDYVRSMRIAFENGLKSGMVAIKVDVAYKRPLFFENVTEEAARKVFRNLTTSNYDEDINPVEAKILQDYMMHKLLELAQKFDIPVAFHTGIQSCGPNILGNSDPALLTNLFMEFPKVRFVLFHGSYPFGGTLTTLVRNFTNVNIDMNWTWSISPSYAGRYLEEWLEAVPASKIMAFGGDQRCVENTYGNLIIAKHVISEVLSEKVKEGYFTEKEAYVIARMILHDNAKDFYRLGSRPGKAVSFPTAVP